MLLVDRTTGSAPLKLSRAPGPIEPAPSQLYTSGPGPDSRVPRFAAGRRSHQAASEAQGVQGRNASPWRRSPRHTQLRYIEHVVVSVGGASQAPRHLRTPSRPAPGGSVFRLWP